MVYDLLSRRILISSLFAPFIVRAQTRLKVVASFSILADISRNCVGDKAEVTSLIPIGEDAHHYHLKPADLVSLKKADFFVYNGKDFEHGVGSWLKSSGFKGVAVEVSRGLEPANKDPHMWQFVPHSMSYVETITKAMPFATASNYLAELKALDEEIKAALAPIPLEKRKVITTHDAFGYFANGYGVQFLSPQGKITGQPSAKAIASLITQIKRENIKAIFIENVQSDKVMSQISRETGAKLGGSLYSDTLSLTDEANSYIKMMRHNLKAIVTGLA